jgi:hypothetical protein
VIVEELEEVMEEDEEDEEDEMFLSGDADEVTGGS